MIDYRYTGSGDTSNITKERLIQTKTEPLPAMFAKKSQRPKAREPPPGREEQYQDS